MNAETTTKKTDESDDKATMKKIAVIVGILAGIATVVGVLLQIFADDGSDVEAYQERVLGTCTQVHDILSKDHGEIIEPTPTGFRIKKDALLAVTKSNFAQARVAFQHLNSEDVPSELTEKHDAAVRAQEAWYTAGEGTMDMIRTRLPDGATLDELNSLSAEFPTMTANVELNNAMSSLAGQACQSTA